MVIIDGISRKKYLSSVQESPMKDKIAQALAANRLALRGGCDGGELERKRYVDIVRSARRGEWRDRGLWFGDWYSKSDANLIHKWAKYYTTMDLDRHDIQTMLANMHARNHIR